MNKKLIVGPHLSIADGFASAIDAAASIGATAVQIFSKSNRAWFAADISKAEAEEFKNRRQNSTVEAIAVHACYLINLASSDAKVAETSVKSLRKEMQRCQALGIKNLILHPGSHTGQGKEAGINQAVKLLNRVLEVDQSGTCILLETMAGQGSCIGSRLEELAQIRVNIEKAQQLYFCLDTCHIFAAGYDLVTSEGFAQTIHELDKHLGLLNIKAIHLNDSKFGCGSKKDRHENLGSGEIGKAGLKNILGHKTLATIPMFLETPAVDDLDGYAQEIKLARSWSS
jgi:deoxyribonuclease-4